MLPIFVWVKEYNCLKNFSINLDDEYDIDLEIKDIKIKKKKIKTGRRISKTSGYIEEIVDGFYIEKLKIKKNNGKNSKNKFYGDNIDSIKAIVGKNGVGKTSLLEILSVFSDGNKSENERNIKFKSNEINFLIIYKTKEKDSEGKEVFIVEGYSNFNTKEYFKFLTDITVLNLNNYFNFKMNIDNKFLGLLDDASNFGIIRLSSSLKKEERHIAISHQENIYRKEKIYKLNLNFQNVAKEGIFNYISSNKNDKNYLNFHFLLYIQKKTYHIDLISKQNEEIFKKMEEKLSFRFSNEKNKKINVIILEECCNNLYQFLIYNEIKKLKENNEIEEKINLKYEFFEKKLYENKFFESLLIEAKTTDAFIGVNIEEFKECILGLCQLLEQLEREKLIQKTKEDLIYKIKNDKNIINFISSYDNLITYNYELCLLTDELINTLRIKEAGMSDGEQIRLNQFATLYRALNCEFKNKEYITILLDEAETYLHPEWCRTLLNDYIEELTKKYPHKKFKIIIATHSPFVLSDLLSNDIVSLEIENKKTIIRNNFLKSFGGNIHNLLKQNMFMTSTFGEFAEKKIKNFLIEIDNAKNYNDLKKLSENILLNEIGEPLIRERLKTMIVEKELEISKKDKNYYKMKIQEYKTKIEEYEEKLRKN